MFQKAMKTSDDTSEQKPRTSSVKQQQPVDRGAAGDRRPEKSFDLSQSIFPPALSSARYSSAAAGSASRDESKTVSCSSHLASYMVVK